MEVTATTDAALDAGTDTVAVGLFAGEPVAHDLPDGSLQALVDGGEARPAHRHLALGRHGAQRIVLVGLGDRDDFTPERARAAAAAVLERSGELGTRTLCWEVPHHVDDAVVAALVEGTLLRAYRFDRYGTVRDTGRVPGRLVLSAHHDIADRVRAADVVARAQNRARDLANTAPNDLTPSALADYAVALGDRHRALSVSHLGEDEIVDAGMGAFAAVAQGSAEPARLIELRYAPEDARGPLIALIGKAVTFDSGGLSLKPPKTMYDMKFDMGGGAAVIEAVAAIAELGLPARVIGVVGAAENLPSERSVKPGDIVRAMDGTTIEVNNTDAEGRLILADCLLHARAQGAERLVDLATLTGAIVTALGWRYAGLFASDDELAAAVTAAGARSGEPVWRMPLDPDYARMIRGRYGRLANMAERGGAQSIVAAELLHHFAGEVPWAHLDIAGVADDVPRPYFAAKLGTGFGVRLLVELVRDLAVAG